MTAAPRNAAAIEVDSLAWLTVHREAVALCGVHKGDAATTELFDRLAAIDARHRCYDAALNLLSYRPRAEGELRDRLRRRAFPAEAIDAAVERLQRAGLLDDAAFARAWIESRSSSAGRGRRALAGELRSKGVAGAAAEQALSDFDDDARAVEAARPRAGKLAALPYTDFRKRLGGFLVRRGFGYGAAEAAVRAVWAELNESEDDA